MPNLPVCQRCHKRTPKAWDVAMEGHGWERLCGKCWNAWLNRCTAIDRECERIACTRRKNLTDKFMRNK